MFLLSPQWVSVPDKAVLCATLQTEQKQCSDRFSHLCLNALYAARFDSVRAFNSKRSLFCVFFLSPTMMQVGHGCQSAETKKKKSVTLKRLLVYSCLSTCRPPVLSQVLPRAHSASQGSVVAVHRMQDLQQLSGSRKECGEWMSEYGGPAASRCL